MYEGIEQKQQSSFFNKSLLFLKGNLNYKIPDKFLKIY